MKKILYVGTAIFIIIGILVTAVFGLKYNFDIKGGTRLQIYLGREFDVKDIGSITKEVLNSSANIEKIDFLGESVAITSDEITDENIEEIILKLNEKYETDEYTTGHTQTVNIPNVRMRDLVSNYMFSLIMAAVIALVYVVFIGKDRIWNVSLMAVGIIVSALLLLSVLAVFRIIIDKSILMSGVITFILTVLFILIRFIKGEEEGIKNNLIIAITCLFSSIGISLVGIFANSSILVSSGLELFIGILIALYTSLVIGIAKV